MLGGILLLAIIHGLIYISIIPPWQHYDEPGHFEYAWLMANRDGLPERGEYDQGMRREVAASMIEHDFYAGLGARPNLIALSEPIWIGISQTDDQPVYYWLVSLPLRLVRFSDITFQLYLGRLVSLGLYILTVLAAFLTLVELTDSGSNLRWLVPLSMVLLPGFTDLMTAVNNDVGAVAFFSLFLWLSVRLIKRGHSWLALIGMVAVAILCFFTKNTVMIAVPLAVLAIIFAVLRGRLRSAAWGLVGTLILVALVAGLQFNGASSWYIKDAAITFPSRSASEGVFLKERYLKIDVKANVGPVIVQPLLPEQAIELRGRPVTLGAWIWASQPMQAFTPMLSDGIKNYFEMVDIGLEPAFYSFVILVPETIDRLQVGLKSPALDLDGEIYYDGLVLVEGDHNGSAPDEAQYEGDHVQWNGELLPNLVRNPSFEQEWIRIAWRLEAKLHKWLPFDLSHILTTFSDWAGSWWYYNATLENLFRTFWAKFGWGHVLLVGLKPYRVLLVATLLGGIGAAGAFKRLRHVTSIELWAFMGLTLASIWILAAARGVDSLFGPIFIPGARYAYPSIVLTMLLLCAGWREVLRKFGEWFRISQTIQYGVYLGLFVLLDVLSIYAIVQYYAHVT